MVDVHAFTLEEDGKDSDFKICKLSESPVCVMTYNLTASPGLKNSVFPDDGTANRNIRILNNFGTVCYLDFEERKGMIGVFAGIFFQNSKGIYISYHSILVVPVLHCQPVCTVLQLCVWLTQNVSFIPFKRFQGTYR